MDGIRWVLLAYRLPREPSTPRIAVWRRLRRLGVAQVADGVVALPLDLRNREQLEWLAADVVEHDGTASIWLAESGTATQNRALIAQMEAATARAYERLIAAANAANSEEPDRRRRRIAALRRELHRIRLRDYFPSSTSERARAAIESVTSSWRAAS